MTKLQELGRHLSWSETDWWNVPRTGQTLSRSQPGAYIRRFCIALAASVAVMPLVAVASDGWEGQAPTTNAFWPWWPWWLWFTALPVGLWSLAWWQDRPTVAAIESDETEASADTPPRRLRSPPWLPSARELRELSSRPLRWLAIGTF